MTQTSTFPTEHIERLERRLSNLESVISRLIEVIEKQGKNERDAFQELFTSKEFVQHQKDMVSLFHQDPAQFVDPFTTYRE